jgi:very-short-patch-repair endonuclease
MRTHSLGRHTGGVWTRQHAEAVLPSRTVTDQVAQGLWQPVLPGVYTDAGHQPDPAQRSWAALLVSGDGAVACGRTAARFWRLPLVDDHDPATQRFEEHVHDVAVTRNVGALASGVTTVFRRQLLLSPTEITRHANGACLTTPGRTLRDLAAVLRPDALVCAMDEALRRRLVSARELEAIVVAAKGSRHVNVLREAVQLADARAETPAESLARLLLLPHIPDLRSQVSVHEPWGELVAVLDLASDSFRLAVEVDGKRGHAGAQMVAKDRRRDRRTESLGWTTVRVTWYDLRRRPQEVVARVLHAARASRAKAA